MIAAYFALITGCGPIGHNLIGKTYSSIDDRQNKQKDTVLLVYSVGNDWNNQNTFRQIQLRRHKTNGVTKSYSVYLSMVWYTDNYDVSRIIFEPDDQKIILRGTSSLEEVDARTYGVYYIISGTYLITPEQIRTLAEAQHIVFTASGSIDQSIELGPNALNAIDVFKETFVDKDGIGDSVTHSKITHSY